MGFSCFGVFSRGEVCPFEAGMVRSSDVSCVLSVAFSS